MSLRSPCPSCFSRVPNVLWALHAALALPACTMFVRNPFLLLFSLFSRLPCLLVCYCRRFLCCPCPCSRLASRLAPRAFLGCPVCFSLFCPFCTEGRQHEKLLLDKRARFPRPRAGENCRRVRHWRHVTPGPWARGAADKSSTSPPASGRGRTPSQGHGAVL